MNKEIIKYCFVLENPPDEKIRRIYILAKSDLEANLIFERITNFYGISQLESFENLKHVEIQKRASK